MHHKMDLDLLARDIKKKSFQSSLILNSSYVFLAKSKTYHKVWYWEDLFFNFI